MLIGNNIKAKYDALSEISLHELYENVLHPDASLQEKIEQLRIVRELDAAAYRKAKTSLPYIVCGNFSPAFRNTENFVSTDCFILDIDHLTDKGMDIQLVREKLEQDSRVALSFVSPGEDGLKLFFRLSEKCYDSGKFSMFYKIFAASFSRQYNLEEVCDTRTCDVCRACFLSVDQNAFIREDSTTIDMSQYISDRLPFDIEGELPEMNKDGNTGNQTSTTEVPGPDESDIERIKMLLFKKRNVHEVKKIIYVPAEVNAIVEGLSRNLAENNILLNGIVDIHYGKKFMMSCSGKISEVNVFYGKNGFTVVPTPKRGTDPELNDLLAEWINSYLKENRPYGAA